MIAVSASLPNAPSTRPPIVLVHGAANSAGVWTYWQRALADEGWGSYAVDLRGHGCSDPIDLSTVSMHDYADDVLEAVRGLAQPPVVVGWSMGGLVAMMAAATGATRACVALAPSPPSREQNMSIALHEGEFGPELYGIKGRDPADQPAMPDLDLEEREIALASLCNESRLARDERKRGIVIETLPCPLLIVTGSADRLWGAEHYRDLWLPATTLDIEGASHWGLVLSRRALTRTLHAVLRWMEDATR